MFILILNNIYSYYGYIKGTEGLREGGDEENGPKRRESRRLGHSVSFRFFLILNNIYSTYGYIKGTEGFREGGDEENGPKLRESRRLGHLVSFFFSFFVFFFTYTNHLTATRDTLKLRKYLREVTTKRTGPNEPKRRESRRLG